MLIELLLDSFTPISVLVTIGTYIIIYLTLTIIDLKEFFKTLEKYNIPGPEPRVLNGGNFRELNSCKDFSIYFDYKARFGDIFGFYAGRIMIVILTDLDMLKEIFFEHPDVFSERMDTWLKVEPLCDGLLFSPRHRWKPMRKILTPAFSFYGSKSPNSTKPIEEANAAFLKCLNQKRLESVDKKTISDLDIHELMKAMALHLISDIAIKLDNVPVDIGNDKTRLLDAFLKQSSEGMIEYAVFLPFLKRPLEIISNIFEYKTILGELHRQVNKQIDSGLDYLNGKDVSEHLESIYGKDQPDAILHRMIKLHHEGLLTRSEVLGNVDTILIAGYDTTSTTLTYLFWCLGQHLDIQDRLRKEILIEGTESKYLMQVINETMRLYMSVGQFTRRKSNRDFTINGITLPKGCHVTYHPFLIHLDPKIWPEPYKYDPDRFREGVEIHTCAFAPFGLGERRCLGYKLSLLEMKMTITAFLRQYKITSVYPKKLRLMRVADVLSKPHESIKICAEYIGSE